MESTIIYLSVQKYKQLFVHKKEIIFLEKQKRCIALKPKMFQFLKGLEWFPMFKYFLGFNFFILFLFWFQAYPSQIFPQGIIYLLK